MEGNKDEHPTSPNLQEIILEYAWTHKIKDLQEVVDTSLWMEAKQQSYSLRDPWRLRVASAQAYSIIKNRDVGRYERVMSFLEASYRLLPTLVVAIKHMKIIFGLKTLVIMWMLKQGQGIVPITVKILQFFPSKLPQYQDHCSNKAKTLMQKNNLDFKLFAQSLAMDKMKLKDYIKNQLEEQYGEHYSQKVEDRLLHYVHKLEKTLPRDTYMDQILRQERTVSYEDKVLLELIAQGSTPIAASLRTLLQQGDQGCGPTRVPLKPAAAAAAACVRLAGDAVDSTSSGARPRSEAAAVLKVVPADARRKPSACRDSPLLFEKEPQEDGCSAAGYEVGCPRTGEGSAREAVGNGDRGHDNRGPASPVEQQQEEEEEEEEEEGGAWQRGEEIGGDRPDAQLRQGSGDSERVASSSSSSPSLQFCSKHQRWVRSILSECPRESQAPRDVADTPSPLLFPSSSSSSSQDLTPSDLVPCDLIQQPATCQTSSLSLVPTQGPIQTSSLSEVPAQGPIQTSSLSEVPAQGPIQTSSLSEVPAQGSIQTSSLSEVPAQGSIQTSSLSEVPTQGSIQTSSLSQVPTQGSIQTSSLSQVSTQGPIQTSSLSEVPTQGSIQTSSLSEVPTQGSIQTSSLSQVSAQGPIQTSSLSEVPAQGPIQTSSLSEVPAQGPIQTSSPSRVSIRGPIQTSSLSRNHTAIASVSVSVLSPVLLPPGSPSKLARAVAAVTDPHGMTAHDLRAPSQFLLQPYVRLSRLHLQQDSRQTEHGGPPSTEEEEEEEEEEEGGGEKYAVFDPNHLFSSDDSSGSDSEDPEDPDYIPSKPKSLKRSLTC